MKTRYSLLTALGLSAGAALASRRWLRRPLPQTRGTLPLKGLRATTEVVRDRWAIPHIYAENDEDLFFAQGFVHAQDRLWQMEFQRRVGSGRIAELVGTRGLYADRFTRILGFRRTAEASVAAMDADSRALADAYAAGVNAFIESGHPLPVEFRLLRHKPEPWTLADTAVWGAVLAWGLSGNWEAELMRATLVEHAGPEAALDFELLDWADHRTILPTEQANGHEAEQLLEAYRAAQRYLQPSGPDVGSNNWVLSPQRTTTGAPILANDPHLPPMLPGIWYIVHLSGGGFEVAGASLPGVPGVVAGHNAHIAWGITNAFTDVQDVYIEQFDPDDPTRYHYRGNWERAEVTEEVIRVRRRQPHVERVRITRHGPVIGDLVSRRPGASENGQRSGEFALRWAGHDPSPTLRAIFTLNRARDWADFRDALRDWHAPGQNFVYADTAGNIGYVLASRVPIRAHGSGLTPVPGWDGEHEWTGYVPFDEMPQALNPPDGYIVTANNRVVGADYPYTLTTEWLSSWRAARIAQMIVARARNSLEDCAAMQTDLYSLPAERVIPHLLRLTPRDAAEAGALEILRTWDKRLTPDSVAATIYEGVVSHLIQRALGEWLGPEGHAFRVQSFGDYPTSPFYDHVFDLMIAALDKGSASWMPDRTATLQQALRDTLADLERRFGPDTADWRWGRLCRLTFRHALGEVRPLAAFFNRGPLAFGGDGHSVRQADFVPTWPPGPVHIIPGYRQVFDLADWDRARALVVPGQSGHPASRHYADLVRPWLRGELVPLLWSREKVRGAAKANLALIPVSPALPG
jgi:penicillin amidase